VAGIDDVARLAGVSTATVSRALSGRGPVSKATRARVDAAARRLGYVVQASASSLASGRTRCIGILVPLLDRWFYSTVLSGVTAVLMEHGYDVTLYNLTTDQAERERIFDTFLRRQRVDGVVVIAITPTDREWEQLREIGHPVVVIGEGGDGIRSVMVDDEAVGHTATTRLLELGHTAIAHIGMVTDDPHTSPAARHRGYERALREAGVAVAPALFAPGDFTVGGGRDAAARVLPSASAVFAASDELAVGALFAARDLGLRVPEDVSIVGVDGHELAEFFGLDSIDQFPLQQGRRAAETVLAALGEDVPAPPPGPVPFRYVSRGSVRPPAT